MCPQPAKRVRRKGVNLLERLNDAVPTQVVQGVLRVLAKDTT